MTAEDRYTFVLFVSLAATLCSASESFAGPGKVHAPVVREVPISKRHSDQALLRCALEETSSTPSSHPCQEAWIARAVKSGQIWTPGERRILGSKVLVEFRGLSPYLDSRLRLVDAARVSMDMFAGERKYRAGIGVPLVAISPRCSDEPICSLLPYSGVFRPVTAWLQPTDSADARLVVGNPLVELTGKLASLDTSAPYAYGMRHSPINRMALWGLLGRGTAMGKRSGVYLMEDYDPHKRPLIMIHGLGSSPLAWARLTNAVWGDEDLRRRYQIWHVVYPTDGPQLVTRRRIAGYLDRAWRILDPEGNDPARNGVVLIGHSLGGVLSRLLASESRQVLWDASFSTPPDELAGNPADIDLARELLIFDSYPGVRRAIFLGAPHRGSPVAEKWFARLVRNLAGYRSEELQALSRIARDQPNLVRPEMRKYYRLGNINSLTTLRPAQPVRLAAESLLPDADIPYHIIAGVLPGTHPASDGAVPLSSALLPGATSTLVVESGHDLPQSADAISEVLRILHEEICHAGKIKHARRPHTRNAHSSAYRQDCCAGTGQSIDLPQPAPGEHDSG